MSDSPLPSNVDIEQKPPPIFVFDISFAGNSESSQFFISIPTRILPFFCQHSRYTIDFMFIIWWNTLCIYIVIMNQLF